LCGSGEALLLITLLGGDSRGLSVGLLGFGTVGVKITRDERRGIRVCAITEHVSFPQVGELVCVSARVSVENAPDRIVTGDVRVKACIIVGGFRGGGTRSGDGVWGRRTCNHTSRGNSGPRWGRGGIGAKVYKVVYLGRESRSGRQRQPQGKRYFFRKAIVTLLSFIIGNLVILSTLIYFRLCER